MSDYDRLSFSIPKNVKQPFDTLAERLVQEGKVNSKSALLAQLVEDYIHRALEEEEAQSQQVSPEELTFTITLETLEQKRQLEELARKNRRTPTEMLNNIFYAVFEYYDELTETAQIEYRSFIDLMRLYFKNGELGQLFAEFFTYLDQGNRPPDDDCIRIAALLEWEPERVFHIRDRCFKRKENGDIDCVNRSLT